MRNGPHPHLPGSLVTPIDSHSGDSWALWLDLRDPDNLRTSGRIDSGGLAMVLSIDARGGILLLCGSQVGWIHGDWVQWVHG